MLENSLLDTLEPLRRAHHFLLLAVKAELVLQGCERCIGFKGLRLKACNLLTGLFEVHDVLEFNSEI